MSESDCFRSARDNVSVERRSISNRRHKSGISVRSLLFGGRRKSIRRFEDKQKLFYVDQYSQRHFGAIVLILFLSVIDAILTIILTNHDATEINPIMAYYLNVGPFTFLSAKYLFTSVGLIILLMLRNIFMRPLRIYAGSLFYYLLAAFIGVVSWQFFFVVWCNHVKQIKSNAMDRKDSRKFFNKDKPVIVDCHYIDGRFQGILENISSSGVFINTDKFLPVGQELAMTFTLPRSNKKVKATGEIVRSTNLGIAVEIKVIFKD